ncbi:MAG: Nascent polypeptide-associated complex protein [Methanobacteriota archaeon]|nr:MAG: Nascent polypeptide-associated complex protein [Euryarchaeota archaeon]
MSARRKARRAARKKGGLPGVSPKNMKKAMGQMDVQEIDGVREVVIRKDGEEIVLKSPDVQVLNMGGQEIYTITAAAKETRTLTKNLPSEKPSDDTVEVSDADVKFIAEKAGVSEVRAREALIQAKGDLASALLSLSQ